MSESWMDVFIAGWGCIFFIFIYTPFKLPREASGEQIFCYLKKSEIIIRILRHFMFVISVYAEKIFIRDWVCEWLCALQARKWSNPAHWRPSRITSLNDIEKFSPFLHSFRSFAIDHILIWIKLLFLKVISSSFDKFVAKFVSHRAKWLCDKGN